MNTIVQLSKYGFKLDSLKNDWTPVDKNLLSRQIFQQLKKGMSIEITEKNKSGFVIDFKLAKPMGENNSYPLLKSSPIDHNILKGQCLNIVFTNLTYQGEDLSNSEAREKGIRNAQKLLYEIEMANFAEW